LRSIRGYLITALNTVGKTAAALAEAKRRYTPDRQEYIDAQTAANNAVAAVASLRTADKNARDYIHTQLANWVPDDLTLDAELGRLLTNTPLLLFPVRIETRFGVDSSRNPPVKVLRVRIYPDEIWINLHEAAVTQDEYDAAVQYYNDRDSGVAETELWRRITRIMTVERAAYVLRLLTPTYSGGTSGTGTSTGTSGPSVGPEFPTDVLFKQSDFSRPAEAVLPDRWFIRTVGKNPAGATEVVDHRCNPIAEPLTVTPDPQTKNPSELFQIPGTNPPLLIDDELAWTVDFDRAVAAGMAKMIDLRDDQATAGFDKILVFGVKTSLDVSESVALVEQLFDGHHYTRGLALVPQGTATNNTEDEPTIYPVEDPDGAVSYPIERLNPPTATTSSQHIAYLYNTDGAALAQVLGVHNGLFNNVGGTQGQEQGLAHSMAKLMWPTTFGYVIEQLMSGVITPAGHNRIRDYFIDVLRARGPAPAFRIGQVPYGVLPALSVVNWKQRGSSPGETFEKFIQDLLLRVRETWKQAAQLNVPKVTAGSADPLADLLKALALHPSGRELYARQASGLLASLDMFNLAGFDAQAGFNELQALGNDLLNRVAQPGWIQSVLAKLLHSDTSHLVAIPMVGPPEVLAENQKLPSTFSSLLASADILSLIDDVVAVPDPFKKTMFYKLARNALLYSIVRQAIAVAPSFGLPPSSYYNLEATVIAHATDPLPFVGLLLAILPGANNQRLGDIARGQPPVTEVFDELRNLVENATTPEIERLLTETLDLSSHRLDAWLTAFATRRLLEMRAAQAQSTMMPVGNYLGGYAFVENVRPVAKTTTNLPGYGTVETQPGSGGFVHAPSLAHATAATILRNGYVSYRDESPTKYAFDLSSARVRAAREVFEEMRAGQPLGAVFGYRFERGVQQNYPPTMNLNQYRIALRRYYPLVANKAGGSTTVPPATVESVAARNVVDGLALWNAYQANTIPWDTAPDLPRRTTVVGGQTVPNPTFTALVAEIKKLGDAVDGVSDLNIAEGVLQLVRGSVTGAAGNLDALARGARPPESEMGLSQRGGIPAAHRVALVFTGAGVPTSPGEKWTPTQTPRAQAERALDNWVGRVLGEPDGPKARITLDPVDPQNGTPSSVDISLGELGLRPLDVVAIARASATANAGSILDRRFASAATQFLASSGDTDHTVGAITYNPPSGPGSIPQVMEVARAIGALLGGARTLASDDLTASIDADAARAATEDANKQFLDAQSDIQARGAAAMVAMDGIASTLEGGTGLVAALTAAADYFADAFPAPGSTDDSLKVTVAPSVAAELRRRIAAAADAIQTLAPTAAGMARQRAEQFRALFGNDFLVLLPFEPPNAAELGLSLGGGNTLLPTGADKNVPQQFLQQAAQVYEGLGRFRTLSLYMSVLNAKPPFRFDLAQLPYVPGERWIGLDVDPTNPPLPGRQSLLLYSPSTLAPAAADVWSGIVIQDWVETIPNATETNALGFHYDNPGAEAAQAVLVVPPSSLGTTWTAADVWATLSETLDLAKIRGVDLEVVGGFGQFLPAIYAPVNFENATPSMNLGHDLVVISTD
jgi:hypothetical protein